MRLASNPSVIVGTVILPQDNNTLVKTMTCNGTNVSFMNHETYAVVTLYIHGNEVDLIALFMHEVIIIDLIRINLLID